MKQQLNATDSCMASLAWLEEIGFEFSRDPHVPSKYYEEASDHMEAVYGIKPPSVPVYFAESGLGLFGGACFLQDEGQSAVILRVSFKAKEKWLCYHRRELLAHELCHAGRSNLNSRKYEEVIAYQCSSSRFLRYWGGIFHSHREAYIAILQAVFYALTSILEALLLETLFWRFIPLAVFFCLTIYYMIRHFYVMHQFERARYAASEVASVDMSVIYQCDDVQIDRLARQGPE